MQDNSLAALIQFACIDATSLNEWNHDSSLRHLLAIGSETIVLSAVEIKSKVSPAKLRAVVHLASSELIRCEFRDKMFRKDVPAEHIVVGIKSNVCLKFSSVEAVILYSAFISSDSSMGLI